MRNYMWYKRNKRKMHRCECKGEEELYEVKKLDQDDK